MEYKIYSLIKNALLSFIVIGLIKAIFSSFLFLSNHNFFPTKPNGFSHMEEDLLFFNGIRTGSSCEDMLQSVFRSDNQTDEWH